jgi:hypothetical protein
MRRCAMVDEGRRPVLDEDRRYLRQGEVCEEAFRVASPLSRVRFQVVPSSDQFPFPLIAQATTHSERNLHRFFHPILTLSDRVRIKPRWTRND